MYLSQGQGNLRYVPTPLKPPPYQGTYVAFRPPETPPLSRETFIM